MIEKFKFIEEVEEVVPNPPPQVLQLPVINYDPIRENRFLLTDIDSNTFLGIPSWCVMSVTKPNYGLTGWGSIVVEIHDIEQASASRIIVDNIENIQQSRFNFKISDINNLGNPIQEWLLNDCQIHRIDFGRCSYTSDNLTKIIIEFKPDLVTLISHIPVD